MEKTFRLHVNGGVHDVQAEPDMPLLYALRDDIGLENPRFGCGLAQCGACTVHVDGKATRSCVTPVSAAAGHAITTLNGLGTPAHPHPLQAAFARSRQCSAATASTVGSSPAATAGTRAETVARADQRSAGRPGVPLRARTRDHSRRGARGKGDDGMSTTRASFLTGTTALLVGISAAGAVRSFAYAADAPPAPMTSLGNWLRMLPDVRSRYTPQGRDGHGHTDRVARSSSPTISIFRSRACTWCSAIRARPCPPAASAAASPPSWATSRCATPRPK